MADETAPVAPAPVAAAPAPVEAPAAAPQPATAPVSAPILTTEQLAVPAAPGTPASPIAARKVPYKRWALAATVALALIIGGGLGKTYHKHRAAPIPVPIAQSIPALPPLPTCPEPLAAPQPTIPPQAITPPPAPAPKAKKHRQHAQ